MPDTQRTDTDTHTRAATRHPARRRSDEASRVAGVVPSILHTRNNPDTRDVKTPTIRIWVKSKIIGGLGGQP